MSHVHKDISQAARRASTSVAGSLGRAGLFVPQDFIDYDKTKIGSALSNLEDGLEEEELAPDIESNEEYECVHPRRNSFMLSEEVNLLKANGIPIKHTHSHPNLENYPVTWGNINTASTIIQGDYESICQDEEDDILESWDEAVKAGKIKTTTSFELKSISKSAIPLVITFLLQNSLSVCSIFVVGHISSEALAGITLGAMTSNITAIAAIAGLASSLDTFLPQAYGAKKYHLVGLIYQRCCVLIFTIMLFVCIAWWIWAEQILTSFLPDKQAAIYAAQYLKVTSFGIPGYILFETGKRFLQCQGIFDASTYVLFFCAPLNAFLNYFFVWILKLGYIGAPIAVSINYTLMAFGLYIYTTNTKNKVNPMKCWTKFEFKRVYRNWGELIKLSIPNMIMIMSEFLSFEILTLLSSYLGTAPLAAQSILATMASLTYQVPYAVSIACSTRIANFLGAQLPESAYVTCKSTFIFTAGIALLNSSFLFFGREFIANWFTNDTEVIEQAKAALPIVAFMQIFDALNTTSAGCLRGQGLQRIGGYVNLFSYYLVGLPLGTYFAFYWPSQNHSSGLNGLWFGSTIALIIIGSVQSYYSLKADFDQLVRDAIRRSNSD